MYIFFISNDWQTNVKMSNYRNNVTVLPQCVRKSKRFFVALSNVRVSDKIFFFQNVIQRSRSIIQLKEKSMNGLNMHAGCCRYFSLSSFLSYRWNSCGIDSDSSSNFDCSSQQRHWFNCSCVTFFNFTTWLEYSFAQASSSDCPAATQRKWIFTKVSERYEMLKM